MGASSLPDKIDSEMNTKALFLVLEEGFSYKNCVLSAIHTLEW